MQEGFVAIPGSTNATHIKENIDIFDFELTDSEMNTIRRLDQGEEGRAYNIQYGNDWFTNLVDYTYIPEGFDSSSKSSSESSSDSSSDSSSESSDSFSKGINFTLGKLFIMLLFVFFA